MLFRNLIIVCILLSRNLASAAPVSHAATKSKVSQSKSGRSYVGKHRAKTKYVGKHRAENQPQASRPEKLKSVAGEIFKGIGEGAIELAGGGRGFEQSNQQSLLPESKPNTRSNEPVRSRNSAPSAAFQELRRRNSR